MAAPENVGTEPERGSVYWIFVHGRARVAATFRRHRVAFVVLSVLAVFALLLLRSAVHPFVIALRMRIFLVVLGVPLLIGFVRLLFHGSVRRRWLTAAVAVPLLTAVAYWGEEVHRYLALYNRYRTLVASELTELPVTDHERIQPLNSIYSLAHEAISESEVPMRPYFVRIGDEYRWTMGIEPAYLLPRVFGRVGELFNVPGTTPSPQFQREHRVAVQFQFGENLLFGSNSRTAVIRRFGPWRYVNYEPADVSYVTDDAGEWVQVVSLVRWTGLFFPQPEFGGVELIRQRPTTVGSIVERILFGAGEWIPPERVRDHPFLVGQHVLPYTVSRYMAHSFRYRDGFAAPLPGYHQGDIRIADMPDDANDQPFTVPFRIPGAPASQLFHYFALEPYDPLAQGLNTSLFVPADGSGPVYVYRHQGRDRALTGVSAVATKVMESRKHYDWTRNRPVEHRPFIRKIDGRPRFFWLTTVVTTKDVAGVSRFIAGSLPEVIITDAAYNVPVWVDPMAPDSWVDQLRRELGPLWARE